MTIRFKCPHCQKPLSVKDHLAGKKAKCPVCTNMIAIPVPVSAPADVESFAAEAFTDKPPEKPPEPTKATTITFICPFCDEELTLDGSLGGKKTPCPKCTSIVKVPLPEKTKPKDWRTTQTGGPSAARTNLPEQLSDAWGTEQKGRVSREAMEEAGAIPEPAAQPLGIVGWIKRGFWACAIGGAVILMVSMANRARTDKREKNHLEEALKYLTKLEPLQQAEVYRAAGELDVRNLKAIEAQTYFQVARSSATSVKDDPTNPFERDLFLVNLALSQAEMGGSGEDTLKRGPDLYRFDWKDGIVQKDMLQTLNEIKNPDAKASALRALAIKFKEKDKIDILMGPASNLASDALSPNRAQLIGMLLALKDAQKAADLKPPPDAGKFIIDSVARVGYTEGNAYNGDFAEALKIAGTKGPAAGRLDACVAAASIILGNAKNKDAAKEALPFVKEGLAAWTEIIKETRNTPPSWNIMELIRLGSQTDAGGELKELADKFPAPCRPRIQLDFLQAKLAQATTAQGLALADDIGESKNPPRAFAYEAIARHNARLGDSGNINASIPDADEALRPFLHLGLALGEHDRQK